MAKVTLVFAALLIVLGLIGFFGTGAVHYTALIPAWFGVALGIFGFLAISPSESRRKLFMHFNVTIGLIGLIGGGIEAVRGYMHAESLGEQPNMIALSSKLAMTALLLIYVILCVRSFIAARVARKA